MAVGDAYVFPGFLTPVLTQLFFPKPPTTFSHASSEVRGENMPERNHLNWGSNSQPPSHESDTLTTEPPWWGTTESSAWFFNVLGVLHHHMGPGFKISSERQLVIVKMTSPGIEPTTSSFQVKCSTIWAMGSCQTELTHVYYSNLYQPILYPWTTIQTLFWLLSMELETIDPLTFFV